MAPNDRYLLTRQEVEARYGLSKRFLEISAHRGDGPPMLRIGRRMVRYRVADIESWLDARRTHRSENFKFVRLVRFFRTDAGKDGPARPLPNMARSMIFLTSDGAKASARQLPS
jgi:predicted DNA-binding transcriptional regulator AlpA